MDDKKRDEAYAIELPDRPNGQPLPAVRRMSRVLPSSVSSITNNPMLAILGYCGSSILMTTTNKFVLSGLDFNLNFFLLLIQVRADIDGATDIPSDTQQSIVCIVAIQGCKQMGVIKNLADFDATQAKKCEFSNLIDMRMSPLTSIQGSQSRFSSSA
jgi:GDP-mannose transporter